MILSTLRLVTKTATIIAVANTSYSLYKKSKVVYRAYKKTKDVKNKATSIVNSIRKVVKNK